MTNPPDDLTRRHSVAETPDLFSDPVARAEAEARNGLQQFDLGLRIVEDALMRTLAKRRPRAKKG